MNKNILIIGIAGFIGEHIAHYFNSIGYKVYGIGHDRNNKFSTVNYKLVYKFYNSDITYENLCAISQSFSIIINCSGSSSVTQSQNDSLSAFNKTVTSTQHILQYIDKKSPNTRLIQLSSAAVYGNTGRIPVSESYARNPCSIYGHHKTLVEDLCIYYAKNHDIKIIIIRPFSVLGEGLCKQLLWDACNKFKVGNLEFWGTGDELRDWLYIDDLVQLIYLSTKVLITKSPLVINACSGIPISNNDFITQLANTFFNSKNILVKFNTKKSKFDPINLIGTPILAMNMLDWTCTIPYITAIEKYVRWYKNLQH